MTADGRVAPARGTVLVIEDQEHMRDVLEEMLKGAGYSVLTAASGEEGLAHVGSADLVLLDVMLPGRDGWDICREIKERDPHLPVVMVTARAESEAVVRSLEAGADDYLSKPFRYRELLARIEARLRLRQTEAALRGSERRFRRLVESMADGILVFDLDGRLSDVNEAAERMLGFTREEYLALRLWEIDRSMSADALREIWPVILRDGMVTREGLAHRSDGSVFPHEVTLGVLDPDPDHPRVIATVRDITERRAAEERLRESEARLRLLVAQLPAVVWTTDRSLRFTSSRGAGLSALGFLSDEVVGTPLREFRRDARAPTMVAAHERALQGEPVTFQDAVRDRAYLSHVEPLLGPAGEVVGTVGVALDITERAEAEAHYRRLVETSPMGIYVLDASGRCTEVNPALAEVLGRPAEDLLGMHFLEVIAPEDRERLAGSFRDALAGRLDELEDQLRVVRPAGDQRTVNVRGRLVRSGAGVAAMHGVVHDVTEQVRLEQQLRQAQKMEAVGRLAGGVAHDFNNMLTAISGFASLLAPIVRDGGEAALYVGEIRSAAARSADLTRQLLAFGRRQVLQPRRVEINDVVREAERMLRRLLPEHIEIDTRLDPRAGRVEVDPTQVQQVLINLAVNARDAMPSGGQLVIRSAPVQVTGESPGAPSDVAPGAYAALSVHDTGCGMTDAVLAQVFEPFFTTKPAGEGTGLGLSTAYGIMKQSGGYIWGESTPGEGSVFTVLLPREPEAAATGSATEGSEPDRVAVSGGGTILLAEDEDAVRLLARLALRKAGYRVLEARNGEEAVSVAQEYSGTIDLLLTDVVMPRMGGKELARRLRGERPDLEVVFMSGYPGEVLPHEESRPEEVRFLQKPFPPNVLIAEVRSVLEHRDRA